STSMPPKTRTQNAALSSRYRIPSRKRGGSSLIFERFLGFNLAHRLSYAFDLLGHGLVIQTSRSLGNEVRRDHLRFGKTQFLLARTDCRRFVASHGFHQQARRVADGFGAHALLNLFQAASVGNRRQIVCPVLFHGVTSPGFIPSSAATLITGLVSVPD